MFVGHCGAILLLIHTPVMLLWVMLEA
jgi:hypothetical protein